MTFRLVPLPLVGGLVFVNDCQFSLDVKDEMLESMNEKADDMRKRIVDILGEEIGIMDEYFGREGNFVSQANIRIKLIQ